MTSDQRAAIIKAAVDMPGDPRETHAIRAIARDLGIGYYIVRSVVKHGDCPRKFRTICSEREARELENKAAQRKVAMLERAAKHRCPTCHLIEPCHTDHSVRSDPWAKRTSWVDTALMQGG